MLNNSCTPTAAKRAVLLINTGSPDEPTPAAVRRYLAQFLSDERVVELPRWQWQPILHGIVLRTRPAKSAARYRGVWTASGSPLIAHTKATAEKLQKRLGEDIRVAWAMCYGNPSIAAVMDELAQDGIERILVFPLFAQYASQTTGACFDAVFSHCMRMRSVPALRTVRDYHLESAYIRALADRVRAYWAEHGSPSEAGGRLLLSFHGIPQKSSELGDVYESQCQATAGAVAAALGLTADQWGICFQSRFGRDEWLRPYSIETVEKWGEEGVRRIDVICPGFAADCLETIEEIGDELRGLYLAKAPEGASFHYIAALNAGDDAVQLYADIARRELAGW